MSDFEERFPDELISAYLDGELSPAEKARVEEQLMDSAEHRRLFEELRALRDSVKGLPQVALDEGFAQRVLQRAEEEAAAQAGASSVNRSNVAEAPAASPAPTTSRGHFRGLLWAAATLAAAIALLVFNPLGDRHLRDANLALHTEKAAPAPKTSATEPKTTEETSAATRVQQLPTGEAGVAPHNAAHDRMVFGSVDEANRKPVDSPTNGVAAARPDAAIAADKLVTADERKNLAPQSAARRDGDEPGPLLRKGNAGEKSYETAGESQVPHAKSREFAFRGAGLSGDVEPSADKGASAGSPPQKPLASPGVTASAAPFGAKLQRSAVEMLSQSHDGVVVVNLDVRPEALASHFIDRLLSRHEIDLQVAQVEKRMEEEAETLREKQSAQAAAADVVAEAADSEADAVNEQSPQREALQAESPELAIAAPANVDVVYVEATPEQVNALLAELRQSKEMVLAMGVTEPREQARALRNFEANSKDAAFGGQGGSIGATLAESPQAAATLPQENRLAAEQAKLKESDFAAPKPESAAPIVAKAEAESLAAPAPPPAASPAEAKLDAPGDGARSRSDDSLGGGQAARQRGMAQRLPLPSARRAGSASRMASTDIPAEGAEPAGGSFGAANASEIPIPAADEAFDQQREQQLEVPPAAPSLPGGAGGEEGQAFAPQAEANVTEAGQPEPLATPKKDAGKASPRVRVLLVLRAAAPNAVGDLPATKPAADLPTAEALPAEPRPTTPPSP